MPIKFERNRLYQWPDGSVCLTSGKQNKDKFEAVLIRNTDTHGDTHYCVGEIRSTWAREFTFTPFKGELTEREKRLIKENWWGGIDNLEEYEQYLEVIKPW
jgi:hypothetical protein